MASQTQIKRQRIIIQGVNKRGQLFHPRDWAERLCGCMSSVGPNRHQDFSPYVYISFHDGAKSLVVEPELYELDPNGYQFLVSFAKDNNLKMTEDSGLAIAVNQ